MSDTFNCLIGLRQGCSLSPILFAVVINELYDVLHNSNTRDVQLFPDIVDIVMLMFADDIAVLSDTVAGLQRQLNILYAYCLTSKFYVNITKTKVLVFKLSGSITNIEYWTYVSSKLEIVNGFPYVGLYFSNRLSLYKMSENMARKSKVALVCILNSLHSFECLPYKNLFF